MVVMVVVGVVVIRWWWCSGNKYPAGENTGRDKIICIQKYFRIIICFIHSMLGKNPTQTNSKIVFSSSCLPNANNKFRQSTLMSFMCEEKN